MESWELHNGELTSAERLSSTKKLSYCGALWVLKMLQSYSQDIDFILYDGLSQDCPTKHFSVGCSKSLLCLQSFLPLYFYLPHLLYLTSCLLYTFDPESLDDDEKPLICKGKCH